MVKLARNPWAFIHGAQTLKSRKHASISMTAADRFHVDCQTLASGICVALQLPAECEVWSKIPFDVC